MIYDRLVAQLGSNRRGWWTGWNADRARRHPQRQRRVVLEALEPRCLLATLTVTTLADLGPGSLRAAIEQANLDPEPDTIAFAAELTGTIELNTPLPDLATAIVLDGPGASVLTVARNPASEPSEFRILNVSVDAEVAIAGLTLAGGWAEFGGGVRNDGTLTLTNVRLSGNQAWSRGGGIWNSGTLTIQSSTFNENSTTSIGGTTDGGGIWNSGTLTVIDSTFRGNSASSNTLGPIGGRNSSGGAIANTGTGTIINSTFEGNSAFSQSRPPFVPGGLGSGGGVANTGSLTLNNVTFHENSAQSGGGIANDGTLRLANSTLSLNSGSGISNDGTATLTNTTLSANFGGGIRNDGTLTLTHATLSGNLGGGIRNSGMLTLATSIFANPPATSIFAVGLGGNLIVDSGTVTSEGHNLFTDQPNVPLDPTDLINTDPLLAPLANNGGPTRTHALRPGSPAINAGVSMPDVTTDQRGVSRPQGTAPDIGAFELEPVGEPFIVLPQMTVPNLVGTAYSVTATALGPDLFPLVGVPLTFQVLSGPNAGASGTTVPADGRTDAEGRIRFTFEGIGGIGTDILIASATLPDGGTIESSPVSIDWTSLTVSTTNDSGPGSLRSAIVLANLDPDQTTIDFAPGVTGIIALESSLPELTSAIILQGPGASSLTVTRATVPGTPDFRIFNVASGAEVTISGLTISGGRADAGGGIRNSGTLTIANASLIGNSARRGGGGIDNLGTLTLTNSTLSGNEAIGDLSLREPGAGGGILNSGTLTLTHATLSGNSAGFGGGGINNLGTLIVTNATLSGNSAAFGAGISNSGTLTLTHATLSGNLGGGIRNSGTLTVATSIFANPPDPDFINVGNIVSVFGTVTSEGHNLFTDQPDVPLDPTDLINTDPLLAPLASNGGPTLTHALLPGSPAINAAVLIAGVTTDQRGVPRPQAVRPDIGAFEVEVSSGLVITSSATTNLIGRTVTMVVTLTDPDGSPLAGVPVAFQIVAGPNAGASGTTDPANNLTDAQGQLRFTYLGAGGPGTDTVVATAMIPGGTTVSSQPLTSQWLARLPTILNLQRFGFHFRPTRLVLTFNEPMDPIRAAELSNYRLVAPGPDRRFGTNDDRVIPLTAATLDAAGRVLTLRPQRRLPLHARYRLTVIGTPPDGLTDTNGVFLDGSGTGQSGSDFVATFGPEILVRPNPALRGLGGSAKLKMNGHLVR